jgi:hypothetical protein
VWSAIGRASPNWIETWVCLAALRTVCWTRKTLQESTGLRVTHSSPGELPAKMTILAVTGTAPSGGNRPDPQPHTGRPRSRKLKAELGGGRDPGTPSCCAARLVSGSGAAGRRSSAMGWR